MQEYIRVGALILVIIGVCILCALYLPPTKFRYNSQKVRTTVDYIFRSIVEEPDLWFLDEKEQCLRFIAVEYDVSITIKTNELWEWCIVDPTFNDHEVYLLNKALDKYLDRGKDDEDLIPQDKFRRFRETFEDK